MTARHRARRILAAALITAGLTVLAVSGSPPTGNVAGADTTTTTPPACPSSTPPNTMSASAGTPQTTKTGTAFQTNLQVRFTSSDGCPVTIGQSGIAVMFTAPSSGPSGTFSTTGTRTATVGSDSSATATAPAFTANDITGSYTVVATSSYGSATFSLTSVSTGVAAAITGAAGTPQSAPVSADYGRALQARVVDGAGNPVQAATVTFSLGSGGTGPSAGFLTGGPNATATTNASGLATSPPFTANTVAGTFTATAATAGVADPATFSLRNTAASPAALTAGAGVAQGTPVRSPFPIPLAVTVTDKYDNRVPDALVTFTAPTSGPSGNFACGGTTTMITTDADGVAVAPTFVANDLQGGYVVTAATAGTDNRAAFALVNDPPGASASPAPSCRPAPPAAKIATSRIAGADRIATAVAVSTASFPDAASARNAVLARADDFPDALAGGPLAAKEHGPLLLTTSATLDPQTRDELQRALPAGSTVYLLGGTTAVSSAVEGTVRSLGYATQRLAGANRFATAVAVAVALGDPSTVFETTGFDHPDALASVPAAIASNAAILLTYGSGQAAETAAYLARHAVTTRYAVGGQAASADPSAEAVAGADRYATAVKIAQRFFPKPVTLGAASATAFPDALGAGPYLGARSEPLLLVPADGRLPPIVADYLTSVAGSVRSAVVIGGPSAVSDYTKAWVAGLA